MSLNVLSHVSQLCSRLRRDESGAINIFLVGVLTALLTIGMIIIIPLGDAIADRRNANTASDASALATAGYCADKIEDTYEDALKAKDAETFWSYFGKPVFSYCTGASSQASRYAASNGATLTAYNQLSGNRFQVSVRMSDEIAKTGLQSKSTATARMTFERGVCSSGGLLGVSLDGSCYTSPSGLPGNNSDERSKGSEADDKNKKAKKKSFHLTEDLPGSAIVSTRLVASR